MNAKSLVLLCGLVLSLGGCSTLSPELVDALAKDTASMCVAGDIRGGAGGIIGGATGGYGQSTFHMCRSNRDNVKITLGVDGSMSIEHGEDDSQ